MMFPACVQHHISKVFIVVAVALTSTEFTSFGNGASFKKEKGRAERMKAALFFRVCIYNDSS